MAKNVETLPQEAVTESTRIKMKSSAKSSPLFAGLTIILLLAFSLASGCSKKIAVTTDKLDYSFQTADSTNQATVNQAIESIEKADYAGAAEKLKKVSSDPKLTAEQKAAVNDVLQQLEKH
jgi:hypothetical protein